MNSQDSIRLSICKNLDESFRVEVDELFARNSAAIGENLFATTGLLAALDMRLAATQIVLTTPGGGVPELLHAVVRGRWREPFILSVIDGENRLPPSHPAHGKTAIDGKPTAYVCRGATCSLPVTEPEALAALLATPSPPAI